MFVKAGNGCQKLNFTISDVSMLNTKPLKAIFRKNSRSHKFVKKVNQIIFRFHLDESPFYTCVRVAKKELKEIFVLMLIENRDKPGEM